MPECYVKDVQKILDEINTTLIKNNEKAIKRADWHTKLSLLTPNTILPHWVNECFRKKPFNALNAAKVETAIREHLKALGMSRDVNIVCID